MFEYDKFAAVAKAPYARSTSLKTWCGNCRRSIMLQDLREPPCIRVLMQSVCGYSASIQ